MKNLSLTNLDKLLRGEKIKSISISTELLLELESNYYSDFRYCDLGDGHVGKYLNTFVKVDKYLQPNTISYSINMELGETDGVPPVVLGYNAAGPVYSAGADEATPKKAKNHPDRSGVYKATNLTYNFTVFVSGFFPYLKIESVFDNDYEVSRTSDYLNSYKIEELSWLKIY